MAVPIKGLYAGADYLRCKHGGRRRAQAPAADCEAVRQLRPAGTGLRVRVPAGHGAVPEPAE